MNVHSAFRLHFLQCYSHAPFTDVSCLIVIISFSFWITRWHPFFSNNSNHILEKYQYFIFHSFWKPKCDKKNTEFKDKVLWSCTTLWKNELFLFPPNLFLISLLLVITSASRFGFRKHHSAQVVWSYKQIDPKSRSTHAIWKCVHWSKFITYNLLQLWQSLG